MAKISSSVEICNLALIRIGHSPIVSLDESDGNDTLQAEMCKLCYDQARMSLLSRYNWTFAVTQKKLDTEVNDENRIESIYKYQYNLPNDFLKLISVKDNEFNYLRPIAGIRPPYVMESGYLFTDWKPCRIGYIFNTEDIPKFSPMFIDCLVLELAMRLTKVFVDSTTYFQILQMEFANLIRDAERSDCQQIILDTVQSYPILGESLGAL